MESNATEDDRVIILTDGKPVTELQFEATRPQFNLRIYLVSRNDLGINNATARKKVK